MLTKCNTVSDAYVVSRRVELHMIVGGLYDFFRRFIDEWFCRGGSNTAVSAL